MVTCSARPVHVNVAAVAYVCVALLLLPMCVCGVGPNTGAAGRHFRPGLDTPPSAVQLPLHRLPGRREKRRQKWWVKK